jgi:hypothetical protein
LLPGRLRYVGPYYDALARLDGRATPDYLTQLSNRVWIGRRQLNPKAESDPTKVW